MRLLYLTSVSLHLLAVAVWIGGMVALVVVLLPVLRRQASPEVAREMLGQAALRLRPVAWTALGVLVVTGVFQVLYRLGGPGPLLERAFWSGAWGRALAAKLLVVAAVLALSALHDFRVGPRALEVARRDADAPESQRLRRRAAGIGRAQLLLSVVVLVLGVLLAR